MGPINQTMGLIKTLWPTKKKKKTDLRFTAFYVFFSSLESLGGCLLFILQPLMILLLMSHELFHGVHRALQSTEFWSQQGEIGLTWISQFKPLLLPFSLGLSISIRPEQSFCECVIYCSPCISAFITITYLHFNRWIYPLGCLHSVTLVEWTAKLRAEMPWRLRSFYMPRGVKGWKIFWVLESSCQTWKEKRSAGSGTNVYHFALCSGVWGSGKALPGYGLVEILGEGHLDSQDAGLQKYLSLTPSIKAESSQISRTLTGLTIRMSMSMWTWNPGDGKPFIHLIGLT